MNALRVPYEAHTSAVGCASEGCACLREAASAKAGPTKHLEKPRLRAVTHFGVQVRASAREGSTFPLRPLFCNTRSDQKLTDSGRGLGSFLQPLDCLFFLESDLHRIFLGIISPNLLNEPSVPGKTPIRYHNPVERTLLSTKPHQSHRNSHSVYDHLLP